MQLSVGEKKEFTTVNGFPGVNSKLLGGGKVTWRLGSGSGEPTVDIQEHNTPGFDPITNVPYSIVKKIKFTHPPAPTPSPVPIPAPTPAPAPAPFPSYWLPFFPGFRIPGDSVYDGV